jgi:3D (Asp-Asp-Asp) domain-containing protein
MPTSTNPARSAYTLLALGMLFIVAEGCAGRLRSSQPPVEPAPSSSRPLSSPGRPFGFIATAYCQGTIAAVGTEVADGIVAADPDVLPLGTLIRVAGLTVQYNRVYRVMDTGRKIRGHRIDLYVSDCEEAVKFGRRSAEVFVIRRNSVSGP